MNARHRPSAANIARPATASIGAACGKRAFECLPAVDALLGQLRVVGLDLVVDAVHRRLHTRPVAESAWSCPGAGLPLPALRLRLQCLDRNGPEQHASTSPCPLAAGGGHRQAATPLGSCPRYRTLALQPGGLASTLAALPPDFDVDGRYQGSSGRNGPASKHCEAGVDIRFQNADEIWAILRLRCAFCQKPVRLAVRTSIAAGNVMPPRME
jgi:hypothetical protein